MADLAAHFVNLPAEHVDAAIEHVQRVICIHLDLDRSTLWQRVEEDPDALRLTHFYQRAENLSVAEFPQRDLVPTETARTGSPAIQMQIDAKVLFPWMYEQVRNGKTVVLTSPDDFPEEAAQDKTTFIEYGCRATVAVPLLVGSEWLGCMTFAKITEARSWTNDIVRRFELIANILANALSRERIHDELVESRERLKLASDAGGAAWWILQVGNKQVVASAKIRELFQFGQEEKLDYDTFIERIHPDDREQVDGAVQRSIYSDEELSIEYRVLSADGNVRWICSRGRRAFDASGQTDRLMGISLDVSGHKAAEEEIRKAAMEWRTTFDSIPNPVMIVDLNSHIVRANAATNSFLAQSGGMIRENCFFLNRGECRRPNCPVRAAVVSKHHEETEVYDEKQQRWFRESVDPLLDGSQNVNRVVFSLNNITEQKEKEEKLRNSLAEIQSLKDRLQAESDYLRAEIKVAKPYGSITSESDAIRKVLHQVRQVAPTDATVLLYGETGVGKELFAEAIHGLSSRKSQVLIKVNCAALPAPLVESELFGREKGAYTGALSHQQGRFDLANHSSIFLDEIGELSLEVQAKLLRVLQEGQFERLGSPRTVKADVRLIAATNRDLAEEVRKGRFRQDLFYRLNVFPVYIPPLRERAADIPLLVWDFTEEFSQRMGKKITKIPKKTMESLQHYSWPGNVRELRNVIERSVIISTAETLRVSRLLEMQQATAPLTLADTDREHILRVLEKTMWHIKGPYGAAVKLGLKPSTLYTRMQKLGIPNRHQRDGMRT